MIAGLFSTTGASHVILKLGEYGLTEIVLPAAVVDEVRRNVGTAVPEALDYLERFLRAPRVGIYRPTDDDLRRAAPLADPKDVPVMAAAIGSGARILATHNVRHFRDGEGVRVLRPRALVEQARSWLAGFGE